MHYLLGLNIFCFTVTECRFSYSVSLQLVLIILDAYYVVGMFVYSVPFTCVSREQIWMFIDIWSLCTMTIAK